MNSILPLQFIGSSVVPHPKYQMDLPVEVWSRIFKHVQLESRICTLRANLIDIVRGACQQYEASDPTAANQLPTFERMIWAKMYKYCNISKSSRGGAAEAKLSERWLAAAQPPLRPYSDPVLTSVLTRSQQREVEQQRVVQPGRELPLYVAIELSDAHARPGYWWRRILQNHELMTIRRVDVLAYDLSAGSQQENFDRAADLARCIEAEWKAFGVEDGVVRIFR